MLLAGVFQTRKDAVNTQKMVVMQYALVYLGDDAVDPLTAILSLTDDDKSDPRVEAAIEKVLTRLDFMISYG